MAGEKNKRFYGWRWDIATGQLFVNVEGDDIAVFDATGLTVLNSPIAPSLGSDAPATQTITAAGTVGVDLTAARNDHIHPMAGLTSSVPVTQAYADVAATGTAATAARADHTHGMPSSSGALSGATPATQLIETNGTAGVAVTGSAADHIHPMAGLSFAAPVTQAYADAATVGTAATASRADHKHGMPVAPAALASATPATQTITAAGTAGAAATSSRSDHIHPMAGLSVSAPVTQAYGDVAAVGIATTAALADHVHGMPVSSAGLGGATYADYVIINASGIYKAWDMAAAAFLATTSTTNVAAVIQAAINAGGPVARGNPTINSTNGCVIRIGDGIFHWTTTVTIDIGGVTIEGNGIRYNNQLVMTADIGNNRAMIEVTSSSLQDITIRNLHFYGRTTEGHGRGITMDATNYTIEKCFFQNFAQHPIYLGNGGSGTSFLCRVIDCQIVQFGVDGNYTCNGIYVDTGTSDARIINTEVWQGGTYDMDRGGAGIKIVGGTIDLTNVHVWFCCGKNSLVATDHMGGIEITGGDVTLDGCTSESNNSHNLAVKSGGAVRVHVNHSKFYGDGRTKIDGTYTGDDTSRVNVFVQSASYFKMFGGRVTKGITSAPNTYRSIYLNNVTDAEIIGVLIADASDAHVVIDGASAARNRVIDCHSVAGMTYSGASITISTSSVANPTVITTATPHGYAVGTAVNVLIAGHTGGTVTNGNYVATPTGANTFTIPVNATVGGTGGTVTNGIAGRTPSMGVRVAGSATACRVTNNYLAAGISETSSADNNDYIDNVLASGTIALVGASSRIRNKRGYISYGGGVASVADGGTISHGLAGAPTAYHVTATAAAGHIVSVTAVSSTTLTISLKDAAGVAVGVAENVAWNADMFP